jgi:hypothetical protein
MECSTVPGTTAGEGACCSSAGEVGRERPRHQSADDGVLGEVEDSMARGSCDCGSATNDALSKMQELSHIRRRNGKIQIQIQILARNGRRKLMCFRFFRIFYICVVVNPFYHTKVTHEF